jgi:hypothetical protein
MLEEGYQIQVDYLAARVDRAVQLGWSPQTKSEIARQIQSLTDTAREILASKVLGDVGTRFAENEATMARSTWIRSLDLPYNRFIDTPLPPEELRRILDAMHEAAASTAPLALTEEQLNNPESRRILGIQSLVDKVLTAASGSMTYCYRQFNERDRRIEEWNVRANACRDQEIEKAFRTYVPVPPRDPKDARAGTLPASSSRMAPVLPDASTESVRILDSGVSSAPSTRRVGVVLVLALLILVAVSVIARRSR